jgi:hypothetical protein
MVLIGDLPPQRSGYEFIRAVGGWAVQARPGTQADCDTCAGSDSLVAELGFTTTVQLMSWRPGAARLAIAVVRPRQRPASLIIGPYAP